MVCLFTATKSKSFGNVLVGYCIVSMKAIFLIDLSMIGFAMHTFFKNG